MTRARRKAAAFRDALRRGRNLDAAFAAATEAEAMRAGSGKPLDDKLVHDRRSVFDRIRQRVTAQDATVSPTSASKAAWTATKTTESNPTKATHQTALAAHTTAGALHEAAGNTKKVALHQNAAGYHRNSLSFAGDAGHDMDGADFAAESNEGFGMTAAEVAKMKRAPTMPASARDVARLVRDGTVPTTSTSMPEAGMTDELFAAEPNGTTKRFLMGDRRKRSRVRDDDNPDNPSPGDPENSNNVAARAPAESARDRGRGVLDGLLDQIGKLHDWSRHAARDDETPMTFGKNDLGAGSNSYGAESGAVGSENRSEPSTLPTAYSPTSTEPGNHSTDRRAVLSRIRDQLMNADPSHDGAAFEHVERSVAAKGAHDPAALAAWIGRRAEGSKKFNAKAAAGRRHAHH